MYESLCSPTPLGVKAEVSFLFWWGNKTGYIELEKNWSQGIRIKSRKHKCKLLVQWHALSQIYSRGDEMGSNSINHSTEKHLLTSCEMKCSQENTKVLLNQCLDRWNKNIMEQLSNTLKSSYPQSSSSSLSHLWPWGKASLNKHASAHRIFPLMGWRQYDLRTRDAGMRKGEELEK